MLKLVKGCTLSAIAAVVISAPAFAAKPVETPGQNNNFTLAAKPAPVRFGLPTTLSGTLKDRANQTITLQHDPFPLDKAFVPIAQATTDVNGNYTFIGIQPFVNTIYRVVATSPSANTESVLVMVAISVRLNVSDTSPEPGETVTFAGTAKPAHDGADVQIQRRQPDGTYKTLRITKLEDDGLLRSKYKTGVKIARSGTYRVRVLADADHTNGIKSTSIRLDD